MSPPREEGLESLGRYLVDTAVRPPVGLTQRIEQRIAMEPPSTAPRRFRAAVRFGDSRSVWHTFCQNVATAVAPR